MSDVPTGRTADTPGERPTSAATVGDRSPGATDARPANPPSKRPDQDESSGSRTSEPGRAPGEGAASGAGSRPASSGPGPGGPAKRRRRGSRGGRGRNRSGESQPSRPKDPDGQPATSRRADGAGGGPSTGGDDRSSPTTGEEPRRPQIGDSRPAPASAGGGNGRAVEGRSGDERSATAGARPGGGSASSKRRRRRGSRGHRDRAPANRQHVVDGGHQPTDLDEVELDAATVERRRGRERNGRPVGRYLMAVHVTPEATQLAVLEGRSLIQYFVSRAQDDLTQIDGNIYIGRVQNVLPGMEAAFVDIGTPKNAVLYRGDVRDERDEVADTEEEDSSGGGGGRRRNRNKDTRIEDVLRPGQVIMCQVTKNPIAHKGARLTQDVSLPGRFVVLIPNSDTYGISKRLPEEERKRLRKVLDEVRPAGHGLIVRTAAEGVTADELRRDVALLQSRWERVDALARQLKAPALLYREPDMAVRVIREEFNKDYRGVVIDDPELFAEVRSYVSSINPELADRVELHDPDVEPLPLFERHHVHEQLHKAIDRKVWLPSGGSLIIERTEALTVIDVNTGKNVGTTNLEETVYRNNLEAADEIARQLRLRDIGGIIVIDFIDMEVKKNREDVMRAFRDALARDKTRMQIFDISDLGLVEMTRKRISEGLVESVSSICPICAGRGIVLDQTLLEG